MDGLQGFRSQHPEYNDLGDVELADKLHAKFYSDMPKDQYFAKLGVKPPVAPASKDGEVGKPGQNHKDLPGGQPEDRGSAGGFVNAKGEYENRRDAGAAARASGLDVPAKLTTEDLNRAKGLPEKSENQKPNLAGTSMDLGPTPPNRPKEQQSSRTGEQLRDVWAPKLGMSDETVSKLEGTGTVGKMLAPINRPVVEGVMKPASQAADIVLSRLPETAKALLTAGPADLAENFGMDQTQADKLHRDLGSLFDIATMLSGAEAGAVTPKTTTVSDLSLKDKAINKAQGSIGYALGRDDAAAAEARKLADQGMHVAPSAYLKDAPRAQFTVEQSRKMGYDPTAKSGQRIADEGMTGLMQKGGATADEAEAAQQRLKGVAQPSMEESGKALRDRLAAERSQGDVTLGRTVARIANEAELAGNAKAAEEVAKHQKLVDTLSRSQAKNAATAQKMIDQGMDNIDAIRRSARPGELGKTMAGAVESLRGVTLNQADKLYDDARKAAGKVATVKTNTPAVKGAIAEFRRDIPKDAIAANPILERAINALEQDEGMHPAQLHQLRSVLRDLGYDEKLTPTMKKGGYKYLSKVVDNLISEGSPALEGNPKLKAFGEKLAAADKFYADNMAKFRDKGLQQLADNMKSKLPPNPETVAHQIANSDNRNLRRQILDLAAKKDPKLPARIASADLTSILNDVRSPATKDINAKQFLSHIEERAKSGVLQDYYGAENSKTILALARRLAQRGGVVPLDVGPQDNFVKALRAANAKADELAKMVKPDPIKILDAERKAAQERIGKLTDMQKASRSAEYDPLEALNSGPAHAAADRIISSPALISSAIERFGANDPAIQLLQRQALERLLAPVARGGGAGQLTSGLLRIPEESQKLLFPNGMHQDLQTLAKQLDFVHGTSTKTAAGMSAASKFTQKLPMYLKVKLITNASAWLITHPKTVKILAGEVRQGGTRAVTARNKLMDAFVWGTAAAGNPEEVPNPQAPEDSGNDKWWEQ